MNEDSKNIANIRQDYAQATLSESETGDNPVSFFLQWFKEAEHAGCNEVNALTLATVDAANNPHARIVLLKGLKNEQFIFFTNYNSHKGQDLEVNNHAAMVFFWPELQRQVRVEGTVTKVSAAYSDKYFYSRPIGSQIGAIASPQSEKIANREIIDEGIARISAQEKTAIKRPDHWGGYQLLPQKIEFWQGRSNRLHDRIVFEKENASAIWTRYRLAP